MNMYIAKSQPLPQPQVVLPTDGLPPPTGAKKRIAALTTAYFKYSHADDIITKFIEGYGMISRIHEPHCEVVSLYVEQMADTDIGRGMAARYEIPMFDQPRDALTLGGDELAVDGVLLIGEHGDFEINAQGQKLYPRRRLFEEILSVFRSTGRSVPVFNDKHLSYSWDDAEWMAGQAAELNFPLMAGSSVPLAWRRPALAFRDGVPLTDATPVYYAPGHIEDGVDYALYHTLECGQAFVERRPGGQSGIAAVQVLEGQSAWKQAGHRWSPEIVLAAMKTVPTNTAPATADELRRSDPNPVVALIEHSDGFMHSAYLTRSHLGDDFCFAANVEGESQPMATWCHLNKPQRDHFSFLCNHIEVMFRTGRPSYPIDRTLLVTGILAAAAESRFAGQTRVETPHLAERGYKPIEEATY